MTASGSIFLQGVVEPGGVHTVTGAALESLLEWKPRISEAVTVSSADTGALFRARVASLGNDSAELLVFEEIGPGPALEITLLQALPEKERMELVIEKAAELGAKAVIPFESERSTTLAKREAMQKKSHRWPARALKASKQCRRATIAQVLPCVPFASALASVRGSDLKLCLWEARGLAHIREVLKDAARRSVSSVAVASGPEGGFTSREVEMAREAGFIPVTLGSRILRTETAAIAGVALVQYELGG